MSTPVFVIGLVFFLSLAGVMWYLSKVVRDVPQGWVAVYSVKGKRSDRVLHPGTYILPWGAHVRFVKMQAETYEDVTYFPDDSSAESLWKFVDTPDDVLGKKAKRGEEYGFRIIDRPEPESSPLEDRARRLKELEEQYERVKGTPAMQQLYEEERRRILEGE